MSERSTYTRLILSYQTMTSAPVILNRSDARARIEDAFPATLAGLRDIVDEGTKLLGRVDQTQSALNAPRAAHRALLLLFRHTMEMADAFDELVHASCVTAAGLQMRAILEAHMQMLFLLGKRVDASSVNPLRGKFDPVPRDEFGAPFQGPQLYDAQDARGTAYHILELRHQLQTAQLYQQPALAIWHANTTGRQSVPPQTINSQIQADVAAEVARLNAELADPAVAAVNREFDKVRGRGKLDPAWYALYGGPKNVWSLAQSVGLAFQYDMLYAATSRTMHGTDLSGQVRPSTATSATAIAALRGHRDLRDLVNAFILHMIRVYELIVETLRPGDSAQYAAWVLRWAPLRIPLSNESRD